MNPRTTNARRKVNSKVAKEVETQRTKFEKMGLDCKFAVRLMKKGITEQELFLLAKKDVPNFLKKTGNKLTPEEKKYLSEKY